MKIHLGYIASPLTLAPLTYAHTMTYTTYQKLGKEQAHKKLDEILKCNLQNFERVLDYNHANGIFFYRFSHNLVPLATHPKVDFDYITPYQKQWKQLGNKIKTYSIRIDSHPDQFCVLNSTNPEVVESSIKHLSFHQQLFQALDIPGKAILHIGSSIPSKEEAKKRFIKTFHRLPTTIQQMIILENDDKTFDVDDVLEICQTLNIPMVFDYHHHRCNKKGEVTKEKLEVIFATWNKEDLPPKVHFSSPKSKKEFRSHSEYLEEEDFLTFLKQLALLNPDVDIMLECKGRDMALFKLVRQLKCHPEFKFLNDTTFTIKKREL